MNYRLIVLGLVLLGVLVPSVLAIDSWEYSAPGTYNWTCPAGMTNLTFKVIGGGGGGRAGSTVGGAYYSGEGGKAGDDITVNRIAVVPLQNYTIVIGAGGANSSYGTVSNAGTYSAGFGYNMPGGLGGAVIAASGAGGVGETGKFTATTWAQAGTGHAPIAGGAAGPGFGAGGGGGSSDGIDTNTIGGFGSAGYVGIWRYGTSGLNTPDFSGTPLTGLTGTLVKFTDASSIVNGSGLTYNWSFGDGTYSSSAGGVSHVFAYLGSYDVSLTLLNGTGTTNTEIKSSYINIVNQPSQYILPVSPKPVRFTVVDAYGTAIAGANITANYIADSLPNTETSWLVSTFGVNSTVAEEMTDSGVAMRGWSGSDGSVSFIMYSVLQYGITITNTTAGLSKYVTLYPQDTDYTIYCTLTSQVAPPSRVTQLANSTIFVTEPNASWVMFNIRYQDTSDRTTNIKWNVTCLTNRTTVYTKDFGDPGTAVKIDNFTVSTEPRGTEYRAMYQATRSW